VPTRMKTKTKRPTPLSTHAMAAFLTWKQFDLLLLLAQESPLTTRAISGYMIQIRSYDEGHGGTFYVGSDWSSVYTSLRTLERRNLVARNWRASSEGDKLYWSIKPRALKLLEWLEVNV
jgi:DNA-binding PadR family transcriptional regulator